MIGGEVQVLVHVDGPMIHSRLNTSIFLVGEPGIQERHAAISLILTRKRHGSSFI